MWKVRRWGSPPPAAGEAYLSAENQHTWVKHVTYPKCTIAFSVSLKLISPSVCVTCGFPFVILCLELSVRQGQQRGAQLSPLTSWGHHKWPEKSRLFVSLSNLNCIESGKSKWGRLFHTTCGRNVVFNKPFLVWAQCMARKQFQSESGAGFGYVVLHKGGRAVFWWVAQQCCTALCVNEWHFRKGKPNWCKWS